MPDRAGRRRAVVAAIFATTVFLGMLPSVVVATEPPGVARFMEAIGEVESGGRYDAINHVNGAIGKYQVMPSNWRAWAKVYLGNADARPTPANQDRVARAKFRALWRWLGSWGNVAHWWLTGSGSTDTAHWSAASRRYVNRVIALYRQPAGKRLVYQESSDRISYEGSWPRARHPNYGGDAVRYATAQGASATVTFSGRSVIWIGPTGPTRGKAAVYVDGKLARTVDLRAAAFHAQTAVFSTAWPVSGRHTLRIVVLGAAGRPMVAIDEFRIGI